MQEMKLGTGNILEQSLSPYHTGENWLKKTKRGDWALFFYFVGTLGGFQSSFFCFFEIIKKKI